MALTGREVTLVLSLVIDRAPDRWARATEKVRGIINIRVVSFYQAAALSPPGFLAKVAEAALQR